MNMWQHVEMDMYHTILFVMPLPELFITIR